MFWSLSALLGAGLLVLRNALQSGLVTQIGTIGATQVRFLYGLPFAALFLAGALTFGGEALPPITGPVLLWATLGGMAQIAATALMLFVMKTNGFAISTAWLKGEPVIVALIGWALLGDPLTAPMLLAIAIAVAGVLILSLKPGMRGTDFAALKPALLGLLSGGLFGVSAIGFRGAIIRLPEGSFLARALTVLALSLLIQAGLLLVWMLLFDRRGLVGSLRAWRASIPAGFCGAAASACLFTAFSLASAAHVRTVALTEVIFALFLARFHLGQTVTGRQLAGIITLMIGVAALLWQG